MAVAIPFVHRAGGHCSSSAMRDMLEFRGLRFDGAAPSEGVVFGLGAGLECSYFPRAQKGFAFYLGGRRPAFEESLLARVGGSLWRRAEPDNDEAWAYVRGKLDAGEPVPLVADCQKLSYLRTRASMPQHAIVLTGYDDEHALVADNDRATLQQCTLASLREARSSRGFPLPAMNVTLECEWPPALPPLAALVRPALAEQVAWLRAPSGPACELLGAEHFGIASLARFEGAVREWERAAPESPESVALALWIGIEKAGTGGGFFRRLYRDFLAEATRVLPGATAVSAAHAHYAALADGWSEVGQRAMAGYSDALAAGLVRLCAAEREGIELLARAAREG